MPEERLYSAKASITFGAAALTALLLAIFVILGGCANSCKQRAGDGICVDQVHNSAG